MPKKNFSLCCALNTCTWCENEGLMYLFFFLSDLNNDKQLKSVSKKGKRKKDMSSVGSLEGKETLP